MSGSGGSALRDPMFHTAVRQAQLRLKYSKMISET